MTLIPLIIATLCYCWASVSLANDGNNALAVTYAAYAVANLGLTYLAVN